MFAARVVEAVYVFVEGDFDLSTGLLVAAPDEFGLQRLEDAFDGGIVVAIALAAHPNLEPVLAQQLLIVVSTVLRPAVRMRNATWRPSDRPSRGCKHPLPGSGWPCSTSARPDPASCGC